MEAASKAIMAAKAPRRHHHQGATRIPLQIDFDEPDKELSLEPANATTVVATRSRNNLNIDNSNCIHRSREHNHHNHESVNSSNVIEAIPPLTSYHQTLACDMKSFFECPICTDFAVPPIYQCQNGHLVCHSCITKINSCPTCRVSIPDPPIRNLQLDRLANTFPFPCKYNFNGCQWKSFWFKKQEHEDSCKFISCSCPCPGTACKWTGLLVDVLQHLGDHHKGVTTLGGEDIVFLATDINLKGAVDWVMIQSCFNHHFLLVLEKQEIKDGQQKFFALVQLIGSHSEAVKFKYKLELSSNQGLKRLQWEARTPSILNGVQGAIATHDCLVFDDKMAKHFLSHIIDDKANTSQATASGNHIGNLGINVTIDQII